MNIIVDSTSPRHEDGITSSTLSEDLLGAQCQEHSHVASCDEMEGKDKRTSLTSEYEADCFFGLSLRVACRESPSTGQGKNRSETSHSSLPAFSWWDPRRKTFKTDRKVHIAQITRTPQLSESSVHRQPQIGPTKSHAQTTRCHAQTTLCR